jgi:LmbE family N-acetylglucosaminyl deacetylase
MPGGILLSFAHPDDESFSGAGLAAWCLARGREVALVCATRGDRGHAGHPDVSGAPPDVAAARERELREAARIIGIGDVHVLAYRDRELAAADPAIVRRELTALLRCYQPAVVLTFDPNGFNLHPDHIAISRFTSDALAAAADARWMPELGPPHTVSRLIWTSPIAPWEVARSADPAGEPGVDFLIDISSWSGLKADALRAHRTQHVSVEKHFFGQPDVDRILGIETYRQAWGPPLASRPCPDVFAGLH